MMHTTARADREELSAKKALWRSRLERWHGNCNYRAVTDIHRYRDFSHTMYYIGGSQDGDYYTVAQCEAMVMCGNNHWIITPNLQLARSIQIDPWPGGPKSYLWQPVIASPVIQQTRMEEPQTAVFGLVGLGLVSVAY